MQGKYVQPDPPIDGWMTSDELQWLYEQAQKREAIAEIGCWFGRSTHALLSGCRGVVYAIDHFKGSLDELYDTHSFARDGGDVAGRFIHNCGAFANLRLLSLHSQQAAFFVEDCNLDMVFIDGQHTYEAVCADVDAWLPKIRPGGLLSGHDRDLKGVPRMLEERFPTYQKGPGSIWSVEV